MLWLLIGHSALILVGFSGSLPNAHITLHDTVDFHVCEAAKAFDEKPQSETWVLRFQGRQNPHKLFTEAPSDRHTLGRGENGCPALKNTAYVFS
jgi:hypothetical protein